MNRTIIKIACTLCFILVVVAGLLKIIHADNADTLLIIGLIASYFCLSIALFEVVFTKSMNRKTKALWFIAFIVTGWFALLIYAFIFRRGVTTNAGPNNSIRTT